MFGTKYNDCNEFRTPLNRCNKLSLFRKGHILMSLIISTIRKILNGIIVLINDTTYIIYIYISIKKEKKKMQK